MNNNQQNKKCCLCQLTNQKFTEHHLIPKTEHNHKNKKIYTNEQLNQTITCCIVCHNRLHSLFTEKTLAEQYNTIDKIINNGEFNQFVIWRQKHPNIICSPSKQQKGRR